MNYMKRAINEFLNWEVSHREQLIGGINDKQLSVMEVYFAQVLKPLACIVPRLRQQSWSEVQLLT